MTPLFQSEKFVRIAAPAAVGALLFAGWEIACRTFEVPAFLLPKPSDILVSLHANWAVLIKALLVTMRITLEAFATSVLLGTFVAFVFVQSRALEVSLFPYAVLLQVTPVVAIAPLIIILVKKTELALMVCATLVALFPIIANTTIGLRSVDAGLASYFRMNRASRFKTLLRLRIPSALPYFFAGLRISSGLALIGAVVAEFVAGTGGREAGLAYQILQAGFALDIPLMFAALALISVAGIVLFGAMAGLSSLALAGWHESELRGES